MNIEHLREFSYLAETLSFGITAKHFFISTSVLSKHIAAMEDALHAKLFERDRHSVELTVAGKCFYTDISSVLTEYDHALEHLRQSGDCPKKTLRIGYLRGAAQPVLAMFVDYFEKNFPNIDLQITCMEYSELLLAHRSHIVDALISMELDPEAQLACDNEDIYTDHLFAVVGESHPLAAKEQEGISIQELAGANVILPNASAYPGYAEFCESLVERAGKVTVVKRYKDIDTLFFRLADGTSVGFTSGHNAVYFMERASFIPINDVNTAYEVTLRWLRVTDDELVDAMRKAAQACAEYIQRHPVASAS